MTRLQAAFGATATDVTTLALWLQRVLRPQRADGTN